MILRNFLFKLLKNRPNDGYHVGIQVDGINTSDELKKFACRLVESGCLSPNWAAVGRNQIQGQFNYARIEEIVKNAEYT